MPMEMMLMMKISNILIILGFQKFLNNTDEETDDEDDDDDDDDDEVNDGTPQTI